MKKNIGSIDKVARVIIGIAAIMLGIIFQSWWGLIGIISLITGIVGICPFYSILGLSTLKEAPASK